MKPPRWRRGGWVNERWKHRAAQTTRAADLHTAVNDDYDISAEEFDAAKTYLMERYGEIPPSLQRVADRGGRFKRATVIIEEDETAPAFFDEHDLAVIAAHEEDVCPPTP
jgi:hypothetical protein